MRRFLVNRKLDISGVSGTGVVAEGVVLSNGKAILSWLTDLSSLTIFESIDNLIAIHGHEGATEIIWIDNG